MAASSTSIEVPITPSEYLNELLRERVKSPSNSLLKRAIGKFACVIVRFILLIYDNTRKHHVVDDPYKAWIVSGLAVAAISLTLAVLAKYICAVTLYCVYCILYYGIAIVYLTVRYIWHAVSAALRLCAHYGSPNILPVCQYILSWLMNCVCQLVCVFSIGISLYCVVFFDLSKKESKDGAGICCICLDRTVNCALQPCGHTLCRECSSDNQNIFQTNRCPTCRRHVRNVVDIYI